jgi:hypothetical protein
MMISSSRELSAPSLAQVRQSITDAGVRCGDSSFDRKARVWHTRLECGAGDHFQIKAVTPSPGIRVLLGDPGESPEVAPVPEKWYKAVEGDSKSNIFRKVEVRSSHAMMQSRHHLMNEAHLPSPTSAWQRTWSRTASFVWTRPVRNGGLVGSAAIAHALMMVGVLQRTPLRLSHFPGRGGNRPSPTHDPTQQQRQARVSGALQTRLSTVGTRRRSVRVHRLTSTRQAARVR